MIRLLVLLFLLAGPAFGQSKGAVDVMRFGAQGDGVTDDCPALNAAIAAAHAQPTGNVVLLPAGTYRVDRAACFVRLQSRVTLRGAGRNHTIILIDDHAAGGDGITNATSGDDFPPIEDIALRDLTVSGLRATLPSEGSQLLRIGNARNVEIADCGFVQSRFMGLVVGNSIDVAIRRNRVFHTNRDGIAVWSSSGVLIDDNEIEGANDDAISAHIGDAAGPGPVRNGAVISNNRITESQGIAALGAKNITISSNTLNRIMSYGIAVEAYWGSPQGNTDAVAVRISNNSIHDVFRRSEANPLNQAAAYLYVGGGQRSDLPAGDFFGRNTPGRLYANGSLGHPVANPGAMWLQIVDNELLRTLPAVENYAQWGYGPALFVGSGGDGGRYTGPIAEAQLQIDGINLDPAIRDARIAGNVVATTGAYALAFDPGKVWHDLDADGLVIENNRFADFGLAGILGPGGTQRVVVRDNAFDGDPRLVAPDRTPQGGWRRASASAGIAVATSAGFVITGNEFRNLATPVPAGANTVVGNFVFGRRVTSGFSPDNLGVGTMEAGWAVVGEKNK